MELAKIGATAKGGVCRLTLTDLDRQGRDLVDRWGREAGLTVTIDKIGNVFMRRPGRNNSLPPIVAGSHIDTQPTGGKFDGNYGVLAALEVVRTLNDHRIETEAPIEVAFWTNEEGSRFVPVMMGSGVFARPSRSSTAYAANDADGKTVKDELERIGYVGSEEPGKHPIGAYFEAHIEQGPVLEDDDKTIGVVTGVLGIRWYDCTVTGMEAHAGPTPMALRKDALQVATRMMQEVVACADRHPPYGRGTVGMVQVHPNSRNVIPGRVKFSIDLRNVDSERFDAMDADIRGVAAKAAAPSPGLPIVDRAGLGLPGRARSRRTASTPSRAPPSALGYSHMHAVSGAGPRRRLHGAAGAGRDDLRPVQGRHQPQRDRGRQARAPRGRLQRAAAGHARAGGRRRLTAQQPHVHRADEACAVRAAVRLEGGARRGELGLVDAVVGEGRPHHALLEFGEVAEAHGHLEATLGDLLPAPAAQRRVERGLRRRAHHALVVEDADHFVERAVVHRLRHVEVPTRAQHARHFAQRLAEQRHRHVVQRLQHQREIEARIGKRDGLGAAGDEAQPRLRRGEVLGVLAHVDLQPGHAAVGMAFEQRARQLRRAAAQFDDVAARPAARGRPAR